MQQVLMIEMGMGVDLQGADTTKAAVRAVRNAIARNYLPGMRALAAEGRGPMRVHVRLGIPAGAQAPDEAAVRAVLPHGEVTVETVTGGMFTPGHLDDGGRILIVNAAIEVGF